jgi:putative ubiquitin-RnfH superfamily antitoxin RatB of RatAB toxin-antitoxin module
MAGKIRVEVCYALPDKQELVALTLEEEATVQDAIKKSGMLDKYSEIDLQINKLGIFARLVKLDVQLRDGDRVEIYRQLIADPKEVRRQRAAEGKVTKKGGGLPADS